MKQLNLFSKHEPINNIKSIKAPSIKKIYLSPEPKSIDDFLSNVENYAINKNVVIEITPKKVSSDATQINYKFEYFCLIKDNFDYPSNTIYKTFIRYIHNRIPFEHNENISDYISKELRSLEYRLNKKNYTTDKSGNGLTVFSLKEETKKKLRS